jgi:hypothetical protein
MMIAVGEMHPWHIVKLTDKEKPMSHKKNLSIAVLGAAAGVGVVWLVKRRSKEVPGLSAWQRVLAQKHGGVKARELAEQVRQRYVSLLAERPLPGHPILRRLVTGNVLPGLALYQTFLQEYGGERQVALAEVDAIFRETLLAKNRFLMAALRVFPNPLGAFKLVFNAGLMALLAEGWGFDFLESSADRIAFNATRCIYLDTLTAYGAPELIASFCKTDEVMAELFPPEIRFIRTHTLGRGDELCDFQYCRVRHETRDV